MMATSVSPEDVDEFVNEEISKRVSKIGWKRLDICFKWMALQRFMESRRCSAGSDMYNRIKQLLQTQQLLNVEYDSISQNIIRINHVECKDLDEYIE